MVVAFRSTFARRRWVDDIVVWLLSANRFVQLINLYSHSSRYIPGIAKPVHDCKNESGELTQVDCDCYNLSVKSNK